jgi:hypothetical protein
MLAGRAKETPPDANKMLADGTVKISHVPLQGRLSRLYNLSRLFEAPRCPRWTYDVFSVSWAREFCLKNQSASPAGAVVTGGQLAQQPG